MQAPPKIQRSRIMTQKQAVYKANIAQQTNKLEVAAVTLPTSTKNTPNQLSAPG